MEQDTFELRMRNPWELFEYYPHQSLSWALAMDKERAKRLKALHTPGVSAAQHKAFCRTTWRRRTSSNKVYSFYARHLIVCTSRFQS